MSGLFLVGCLAWREPGQPCVSINRSINHTKLFPFTVLPPSCVVSRRFSLSFIVARMFFRDFNERSLPTKSLALRLLH